LRTGDAAGLSALTRIAAALRLIALTALLLLPASNIRAAQEGEVEEVAATQIVPEWLSVETASQLAVGIDVLLPEIVPAPFEGEPDVTAYDGFYSLYWLIPGSPPTYLQINGEAGGEIPDFSYYDRNVELVVNAEVQGYPAYHDITPVYDLIYWQVGDVVYSVESSNLAETDSLTLANSLALLAVEDPGLEETPDESTEDPGGETGEPSVVVPTTIDAGDVASIEVSNANGATLTASAGTFSDTGSDVYEVVFDGSFNWQAPNSAEDIYVRFLLIDPETEEWLAVGEATVIGNHVPTIASLECPSPLDPQVLTPFTLYGSGTITIEATGGSFPANWYNTQFDPDADGGASLTGTVPDNGAIDLMWLAPWVEEDTTFTIRASDPDGVILAACDITLIAYVPPTEVVEEPGGGGGEGLPGGPPEEPTEVPIEEPIEEPEQEPIGEPIEEPTEEPVEEPVEEPTDEIEIVEDEDEASLEVAVIEAEDSTATSVPTRTPRPSATRRPATATPTPTVSPTPSQSPIPSATPQPTATSAPVTGLSGMVAQIIGPNGGQLRHPAGATVIIPKGAVSDESTLTIMSIEDSKLPVTDRVDFVPRTGFDIAIADATGRPIEQLAKPATLRVDLKSDQWRRGTVIYWIKGSEVEVLSDAVLSDSSVSAPLAHFSQFAAGVPITGNEGNSRLMYLFAAAVALAIIAASYGVYAATRRQRTLSVGSRRVPARHRRG
jgi:hypothetical protein